MGSLSQWGKIFQFAVHVICGEIYAFCLISWKTVTFTKKYTWGTKQAFIFFSWYFTIQFWLSNLYQLHSRFTCKYSCKISINFFLDFNQILKAMPNSGRNLQHIVLWKSFNCFSSCYLNEVHKYGTTWTANTQVAVSLKRECQ